MSYPVTDEENEMVSVSNMPFDIKKFIFKLIGFLPWILLSILLSYGIAKVYLRYTPKLHKMAAYLQIKDDQENSSENQILEGLGVMPDSKEIQNQIDILQSYAILAGVVDSLNLQAQLYTEGRITSSLLYGSKMPVFINTIHGDTAHYEPASFRLHLFDHYFTLTEGTRKIVHNYNDTFELAGKNVFFQRNHAVRIDQDGYTLYLKNARETALTLKSAISVQKVNDNGGIIEIAMLDGDPEHARDIINTLLKAYNTAGVTDKNVGGYKTLAFLNERVDSVSRELDNIEIEMQNYKSANRIEDISTAGGDYLTQSESYDKSRSEQEGQIQLLESLETNLRNSKSFSDVIPSDKSISEPTLILLINQYNQAVLEYQNQLQISTEKDPIVGRERTNLMELKGNILKNIESIKSGYEIKLRQIESGQAKADAILASIPGKERELVKLKRLSGVKEQLYLYLLQKKEETELSVSSNINNTRIVDGAVDEGVVLPKSSQIITFAFFIGLIIPIIIMVLIDFFNTKIVDRREIDEGTRVPILGELSFDKKRKQAIVSQKSRSVLAEQFRLVRTNLQYLSMGGEKQIKTILVTSFMSGEGKSFVSINLAGCLAGANKKVLLLEMDLRKPKFSKYFSIHPSLGLTDYIVNNKDYSEVIVKSPLLENVDIITSGPVPPNPTELLMSKRLDDLLTLAKQKYDYIIIDSSPVGLVADAFSLGKVEDVTLFILRHSYSYKTTLQFVEKLYTEKRFKNLGLVVNGITEVGGLGYNYGYGYGYSYGYGYGYHYGSGYYEGEKSEKGFFGRLFSRGRK